MHVVKAEVRYIANNWCLVFVFAENFTKVHPLQAGLEELVAYLRIAKAVKATQLTEQTEQIQFKDASGMHLQSCIPTYYLSAELFPENLDELAL